MKSELIQQIRCHFDTILAHGTVDSGPDPNPMWRASLDAATGMYAPNVLPSPDIPPRVERYIHAPGGVTLYWDQPHLAAAHVLSTRTGTARYADAADAYIRAFLDRAVSSCGLFLWGNHYFYDAERGEMVWFKSHTPPTEIGLHTITAYLHEMRPVAPAWDLFWRIDPALTRRSIEAIAEYHLLNPDTGQFSSHADRQPGQDYLEVGGILVETLAWLFARTRERSLIHRARQIAHYSYDQRDRLTDLMRLASTARTWEKRVSTTEVGLWAGSLLRAADHVHQQQFVRLAADSVATYLRFAWDADTQQYFGRLNVADGTPQRDEVEGSRSKLYQPGTYTDIWNTRFPAHDYALALAEACASLYARTGRPEFLTAVQRWARLIQARTYEGRPRVVYAESFGRAIHFLLRAAEVTGENGYRVQAVDLADIAVGELFTGRMFRGHTGEDRYEAVDGVGYLLLALLELETGHPPDYLGFGF
ncbi:MAG: hypothetical protein K8J31_24955 [Anaerolineae bacterium]|nr:hypothetical protein [Anaerolineae bacterium]